MKKRDLALKKSLCSKMNTDLLTYKSLRNKVVLELRKAKVSYYTQLIGNAKGNNNSIWRHLNNLTNKPNKQGIKELNINGKNINNNAVMANELNSYFVQSVEELIKDFESKDFNNTTGVTSVDSFHITEVPETNILEIINKLSNSKTNDLYMMNSWFLKKYVTVLVKPLTYLVNLSIRTCTFPLGWKKAVIVPVFKSGSQDSMV